MKKCCSSASKSLKQLVEAPNSISSDGATTSVVQPNEEQSCQHFSLREFVADMRAKNPKVCNPYDGFENGENIWLKQRGPLDVPRFRSVLCENCVRRSVVRSSISAEQRLNAEQNSLQICIPLPGKYSSIENRAAGDAIAGDSYKSPIEVIILDDSDDDGVIVLTPSTEALKKVEEEASAGNGVSTGTLRQAEKGPCLDKGKGIIIEVEDDGDSNESCIEVIILDDSDEDGVIELTPLLDDLTRDEEKASAGNGVTANTLRQAGKRPCLDKGKSVIIEVEDDGEEFDTQPQETRNGQTSGVLEASRNLKRGRPCGQAVLNDQNSRMAITANTLRNQKQQRTNVSSIRKT